MTLMTAHAGRRRWRRFIDGRVPMIVLIAVPVAYLALFVGFPIVYNLVMSFQDVNLGNIATWSRPFVGLDNYERLVDDPIFPLVLRNSIIFLVGNVVLQFTLGLGLALLFTLRFPAAAYLRGLVLAGWMLPPLVIGALWKWMLASEFGVVNEVGRQLGLMGETVYWLSDPALSLIAVTIANVWFGLPFNMILLSAGLAGIPKDIYEAAALDGARPVQSFRYITLPLLKPTIFAVIALSTIYTMRAFDLLWAMTRGGPVDSSNVFPLWSYILSFQLFEFGPGAAVATMMFVVVFAVALVYVRSIRHEAQA